MTAGSSGRSVIKVLIIIIVTALTWTAAHNILLRLEPSAQNGPGVFVDAEGGIIHLLDSGTHTDDIGTVVLMTGFGTGSPAIDFKPLSDILCENFRVVTIEPPGYGYSEMTATERTVKNIVSDYRTALSSCGAEPPYILAAHSISGIYAYYFAAVYPEEVTALIGIDAAVPGFADFIDDKSPVRERIIYYTGVIRLLSLFAPSVLTPESMNRLYSGQELAELRKKTVTTYVNPLLADEWKRYPQNAETARSLELRTDIPVLFFIADRPDFEDNPLVAERLDLLSEQKTGTYIIYEGDHYLHRTHAAELAADIEAFILTVSGRQ